MITFIITNLVSLSIAYGLLSIQLGLHGLIWRWYSAPVFEICKIDLLCYPTFLALAGIWSMKTARYFDADCLLYFRCNSSNNKGSWVLTNEKTHTETSVRRHALSGSLAPQHLCIVFLPLMRTLPCDVWLNYPLGTQTLPWQRKMMILGFVFNFVSVMRQCWQHMILEASYVAYLT